VVTPVVILVLCDSLRILRWLTSGRFRSLSALPTTLLMRRAQLKQIIDGTPVQFSESFEIHGRQMYQHACKGGLDGVVSKVCDSAYVYGRGNIVKKTCRQRETLTACRTRTSPPSNTGNAPPR
jgi:hypothetical protein